MKPPGFLEEQACIVIQGLSAFQDMHERRDFGALGVEAPLRLLELLRIAQEHEIPR